MARWRTVQSATVPFVYTSSVAVQLLIAAVAALSSSASASGWTNSTDVIRVVQFSNSLVPPLFNHYSRGRDNLVLAPFGVATNVAMMLEGLQGRAAEEVTALFRLQAKEVRQQLRRGFKMIFDTFGDDSDGDFAGSYNKASVTSSRVMPSSYINRLSKYYQANVTTIRSENSNNSLSDILELRSDTGIISHWKDYQKLATYTYLSYQPSAPFTKADGSIVHVPMIPQTGMFKIGYVPQLKCLAAELMFETDKVSMLIMMPDDVNGSELMIERLSKDNFLDILDSLGYQNTEVLLPQLAAFTNGLDLEPFFKKLGVKAAFNQTVSGGGNNSNKTSSMSGDHASKSPVITLLSMKQNAYFSMSFITINSVGSVGTKLGIRPSAPRQKRGIATKVVFDRPFVFFVYNKLTGLIMLAGKITNPTQVPNSSK
ncbi:leukocyte elastase inhibitor-like [Rhopalosiphum maidis]|uniref:leukocyte elastase inhibitor-like n=1 Tax=Rhopalosiphum maidis TaxID=43146 RepID=UPI000EFDFEE7|nr:leukocyte elastase inhibitor-like [Rhopalosiphum maidis]